MLDHHKHSKLLHYSADQLEHCPSINIANGRFVLSNYLQRGSIAYFMCQDQYYWTGTIERTCQDNGQWSGDAGSCGTFSYRHHFQDKELMKWNTRYKTILLVISAVFFSICSTCRCIAEPVGRS